MKTTKHFHLLLLFTAILLVHCSRQTEYIYPVVQLNLSDTEAHVRPGESIRLTAELLPENTTDRTIVWTSANPDIATINENGVLKGIRAGETLITATAGKQQASCIVTVGPDIYVAGWISRPMEKRREAMESG